MVGRRFPNVGGGGAGWTADSGCGKRPEELLQVEGGSKGEERVGGGGEL